MSTTIPTRKRTALRPRFSAQLTEGGEPLDLSAAAAVVARFRKAYAAATAAEAAMTVDDAPEGLVSCDWPAIVAETPGLWEVEFHITYGTGATPRIVPDAGRLQFSVEAEIPAPAA